MSITFRQWLWDGLKSLLGVSAEFRSDRQKRLGFFLLVSNLLWFALPATTLRFLLQYSQIIVGYILFLHGHYLVGQERIESKEALRREARTYMIKYIAERDGVDLEEAEQTFEEMERWVREAGEEETDIRLELAKVEGKMQLVEMVAKEEGISIKEATEKVKKMMIFTGDSFLPDLPAKEAEG